MKGSLNSAAGDWDASLHSCLPYKERTISGSQWGSEAFLHLSVIWVSVSGNFLLFFPEIGILPGKEKHQKNRKSSLCCQDDPITFWDPVLERTLRTVSGTNPLIFTAPVWDNFTGNGRPHCSQPLAGFPIWRVTERVFLETQCISPTSGSLSGTFWTCWVNYWV